MIALLEEMREALGAQGVLTEGLATYETGARHDRGRAAAVLRPATTREVSAAVAACLRHGVEIVPQSGNTGLVAGSTPDDTGRQVVLSLERLRRVEIDADNRSASVGAGVRLSDLNAQLGEVGFCFPIDLGADPCVGGMVATNTGGARFLRHGDVRTNTLGLTVVLGDEAGTVLRLGRGLHKDNAGVDWKQLFIGTSGAFGIITEVDVRIAPLPVAQATALLVPSSPDAVLPLLRELEGRLGPLLTAFEGMSREAMAAAFAHVPSLRNPFRDLPSYALLLEIGGPRLADDTLLQETLAEVMEARPDLLEDALFGHPAQIWALRHALSEGVQSAGRLIAFDIGLRRGSVMAFCERMRDDLAAHYPGVRVCDFGHVGDGGVHFNLVVPAEFDEEAALRDHVVAAVVAEGGSFSAEHGIGRRNQHHYDTHTPARLRQLARDFKLATSPGIAGAARFD